MATKPQPEPEEQQSTASNAQQAVSDAKREENPQSTSEAQQAANEAKRQYLRQYYLEHRQAERVPAEEHPLFLSDPQREPSVCRLCWLKFQKLPQHLLAEHRDELSEGMEGVSEHERILNYRTRFGYSKKAPLMSKDLVERFSSVQRKKNSQRRQQGRSPVGHKTRFRKGRKNGSDAGVQGHKEWGVSKQARLKMSASHAGVAQPDLRKKSPDGETVSDWQIAKLRIQEREHSEIGERFDLTPGAIVARLRKMRFPQGQPCHFFRGEPITEKHLHALFDDLKFIRTLRPLSFHIETQQNHSPEQLLTVSELAEMQLSKSWIYDRTRDKAKDQIPHSMVGRELRFSPIEVLEWANNRRHGKSRFLSTLPVERELADLLGVSRHRIYEFIVHPGGPSNRNDGTARRKQKHPLSLDLAGPLLTSQVALRNEHRKLGSTARGGRPKALLPSEEKELPAKYRALKADLDLMLRWADAQESPIMLNTLGEWMCQQSRLGKLQVLLFWPSLHTQLPAICEQVKHRAGGRIGSAERAKEFICAKDDVNAAIFWSERYYQRKPIRNLVPLAAHLIVAASKLNPGGIAGLEIVLCDASGCRRLSEASTAELESKANEWDRHIEELIAGHVPELTYALDQTG